MLREVIRVGTTVSEELFGKEGLGGGVGRGGGGLTGVWFVGEILTLGFFCHNQI